MTETKQPEALRLAVLISEGAWHNMTFGDVEAVGRELRRQHANITALEQQLVVEAAKTAGEKLRADQMTEQHRMQCSMRRDLELELATAAQLRTSS